MSGGIMKVFLHSAPSHMNSNALRRDSKTQLHSQNSFLFASHIERWIFSIEELVKFNINSFIITLLYRLKKLGWQWKRRQLNNCNYIRSTVGEKQGF